MTQVVSCSYILTSILNNIQTIFCFIYVMVVQNTFFFLSKDADIMESHPRVAGLVFVRPSCLLD